LEAGSAAAFQEILPDRLRELARDVRSDDPEGAEFLETIHLPLEEREPDRRHEEESGYRPCIPRIARDVDKGALIAGEDLRDQIVSRIEEIRRRARAEGYPF
jgi:hypothetical protein